MTANEKQLAAWDAQLAREGRVEFPLWRGALLPWLLFFLSFSVFGVFVAATVWRVVGLACTALFLVFAVVIAYAMSKKPPLALVVDGEGVTKASPEPAVSRSWSDVVDVSVAHASFRNEVIDVESRSGDGGTEHLPVGAGIKADRETLAAWMLLLAGRAQGGTSG